MEEENDMVLNEETGFFEKRFQENQEDSEDEPLHQVAMRKKNKELRVLGKKYGKKKSRRIVPKSCMHLAEKKSGRSFLCGAVDEENRGMLFKFFWQLRSWEEKKIYLRSLVQATPIIRRRRTTISNKKKMHFDCFLPLPCGERIRVCKDFFLKTFDLDMKIFQLWIKTKTTTSRKKTMCFQIMNLYLIG